MQDNGWSRGGAQGRHRHVPSQQGITAMPKSILRHYPNQPTHTAKPDPTNNAPPDCQISLVVLPATALSSIFHHLDSVTGFRLAQTCRTCASEFAHQRSDFTRKACKEISPTVTRDPPHPSSYPYGYPYGTFGNPVSINLKWENNPGSALRRLYAISQQPDHVHLVNEMWRQAWPKTLWSNLLCDGMPESWPASDEDYMGYTLLHVIIEIQVASEERLRLPWNWLALLLLHAPAAGLRHYYYANAPQMREEVASPIKIWINLQRPAQAEKFQLIMYKRPGSNSEVWSGKENPNDICAVYSLSDVGFPDTIRVIPSSMQQVAITGSWCQVLPDASWPLWQARRGDHLRGLTEADHIAFDLWDMYVASRFDRCQCFEYTSDFFRTFFPPTGVSTKFTEEFSEFKPFTCEVAGQSDWNPKLQKAKVKKVKAKGQKRQAGKSRSSRASLSCQDIDWVIP